MDSDPQGVLAVALSTPLLAFLARAEYTAPDTDPARLCGFTDARQLSDHLIAGFVPCAYRMQRRDRSYDAAKAERRMAFLADRMTDLGRWELDELAGVRIVPAVRSSW